MGPRGSKPKSFGDRQARHGGLERVFVNIGAPVRVAANFILQSIDIPELGRRGVSVQQIVDAYGDAPTGLERIMDVKIQFPEALTVHLTGRGGGAGAGNRDSREVVHRGGVNART